MQPKYIQLPRLRVLSAEYYCGFSVSDRSHRYGNCYLGTDVLLTVDLYAVSVSVEELDTFVDIEKTDIVCGHLVKTVDLKSYATDVISTFLSS